MKIVGNNDKEQANNCVNDNTLGAKLKTPMTSYTVVSVIKIYVQTNVAIKPFQNYNYYYKMMNFTTMNQTNQNLYYMKIQYMISITLLKH